ncbi:hypothetical protein BDR04DRAFT_1158372 [Suillus decipiens]|nr:hypothetical protein BDR04DRAFT_1158372 [Suillus decipiens]
MSRSSASLAMLAWNDMGMHLSLPILKGQPLLPFFLQIHATLEVSLQSQLSSAPMLMLHLILINHDITGGCFELASKFLWPYFPNGGLEFQSVTFDISNALKINQYQLQATAIVQSLMSSNWARVVVTITVTNWDSSEHDCRKQAVSRVVASVKVNDEGSRGLERTGLAESITFYDD